jgi:hypothetical protein
MKLVRLAGVKVHRLYFFPNLMRFLAPEQIYQLCLDGQHVNKLLYRKRLSLDQRYSLEYTHNLVAIPKPELDHSKPGKRVQKAFSTK